MLQAVLSELWKVQCRLNRRLPGSPLGRCAVRFHAVGGSVDVFATKRATPPATALCVVIATHARAEACRALLERLYESLREARRLEETFVLVFRDTSEHDYETVARVLKELHAGRHAFYTSSSWLGKPGRFHVYQAAFDAIRRLAPENTIFLEDDAVLGPAFIEQSLARFDAIDDPRKAVLYLCKFADDEIEGRWIRFRRREISGAPVYQTQWFDLHAFIANRRFFETLRWTLFQPYRSRWQRNASLSSGVSEQFTRRLHERANIYQVRETLAFHGRLPSVLNVDARRARPLDNFTEGSPVARAPRGGS